ncbi:putative ribonuclease H-like domain-containing protein, partial [Tanacetum coccineum]
DIHKNNNEVFESTSDSSVNEIEEENNQVNDRFKKVKGYHVVSPPYTGNYMPSRPNLSFAGLDDSVYKTNVSETITSVPRNESTISKSIKDNLEQHKDWESDSDDDCVTKPSIELNKPSYAKINFVKSNENNRKSVMEQNTYRQAENLKKSQSPKSLDDEFVDDAGKNNDAHAAGKSFDNNDLPIDPLMPNLEDSTGIFRGANDDEDVGAEADLNNLETTMNVSPIPITGIHKDHPKDQIIRDINLAIQTRRMINFSKENAMALTDPSWIEAMQEELLQFKLQKVLTLVDLPKGKRAIGTKWVYRNKKDKRGITVRNKARLVA